MEHTLNKELFIILPNLTFFYVHFIFVYLVSSQVEEFEGQKNADGNIMSSSILLEFFENMILRSILGSLKDNSGKGKSS